MADPASLFPAIGDVLMGRYRIDSYIARGGMGVVMRARQLSMDREVAIKMVLPEFADNEKTIARFDREVRLAKQLRHPHIVELYDYGTTPQGMLYLVMEYLEGEDVKSLLRRESRLPIGRAGTIALQVLDALAEAHVHEIVHRDLKPSNIFVTPMRRLGDFAKLLDFGIAKSLADDASDVTARGEVCGTSAYMAPEMFIQGQVGTSIDVYAMGLILLEMLLGKKVFAGKSSAETLVLHLRKEVDVPEPFAGTELARVIGRATAKRPKDRYPSALEFLEELEPAVNALDPTLCVSQSVADAYTHDLSTDTALLERILQGAWASEPGRAGSGSSDVMVKPLAPDADADDGEFDAAVTQLIEQARDGLITSPDIAIDETTAADPNPPLPLPPRKNVPKRAEPERPPPPPAEVDIDEGEPTLRTSVPPLDDPSVEERVPTAVTAIEPMHRDSAKALAKRVGGVAALVVVLGGGAMLAVDSSRGDAEEQAAATRKADPRDGPDGAKRLKRSDETERPALAAAIPAELPPPDVAAGEAGSAAVADAPTNEPDEEPPSSPPDERLPAEEPAKAPTVRVESVPPGATILSDGEVVGETPAELEFPAGDAPGRWRLELDGYRPIAVHASPAEETTTIRAVLEKEEPRKPTPPPRPQTVSVDEIEVEKWD